MLPTQQFCVKGIISSNALNSLSKYVFHPIFTCYQNALPDTNMLKWVNLRTGVDLKLLPVGIHF